VSPAYSTNLPTRGYEVISYKFFPKKQKRKKKKPLRISKGISAREPKVPEKKRKKEKKKKKKKEKHRGEKGNIISPKGNKKKNASLLIITGFRSLLYASKEKAACEQKR
jgi:hypothetical protein